MTPDYKDLRDLETKIHSAPWIVDSCGDVFAADGTKVFSMDNDPDERIGTTPCWSKGNPNAAFIAAARNGLPALLDDIDRLRSKTKVNWEKVAEAQWQEEREKLVGVLKATRHLMVGLHTLGWANMDSRPEAPKCISHSEFKYLLYSLQQPVDEALKACADIEPEGA